MRSIFEFFKKYRVLFIAAVIIAAAVALLRAPQPEECVGCKGVDRDIVASLDALMEKSEGIYDNYGSFRNICSREYEDGGALDIVRDIEADSLNVTCQESPTSWALEAELRRDSGNFYCVDNTGQAIFTKGGTIGDLRCGE